MRWAVVVAVALGQGRRAEAIHTAQQGPGSGSAGRSGRRPEPPPAPAPPRRRLQLMQQWDGIRPGRARVMLLGATNRPFDLDEAVLRRFTHRCPGLWH